MKFLQGWFRTAFACRATRRQNRRDHKRVPSDVEKNPVIIGHEFCGELVKIGEKWKGKFEEGMKFSIQPAHNYKGPARAGYSYNYIGGSATYVIIPNEIMVMDCLLPYNGDAFFYGSLSEPMSCIVGAFKPITIQRRAAIRTTWG
jgi:threonine dehydrogenase-like Zn-dependent dehydrogenase